MQTNWSWLVHKNTIQKKSGQMKDRDFYPIYNLCKTIKRLGICNFLEYHDKHYRGEMKNIFKFTVLEDHR